MFCEFVGLPGTGKTTMAFQLYKRLNQKREKSAIYPLYNLYKKKWIFRNLFKFFYVSKYIITNFNLFCEIILVIRNSNQKEFKNNILLLFNFLFFLSIKERYRNSDNVVILDEGIIHHVWAVCVNSQYQSAYTLFDKLFETPEITVKIECPISLVTSRLTFRNRTGRRQMSFISNIKDVSDCMDDLTHYFKSTFYLNFISVRNEIESDIDRCCDEIILEIYNHNKTRVENNNC
ncbi:hypothetical protein [Paenibacillus sp. HB172176]|uniref:hypothetical protein n=1 Tax=Paenibacillus sp. HB172176 TaxID=2493690 RepID=UPI00143A1AE8|nr:hypothetical protein [Paenibacillus sp. HB172176]